MIPIEHKCVLNKEHPFKNPDCLEGVLWGQCDCCGQYFCHVPDGKFHQESCESVYGPEEIKKRKFIKYKV